MRMGIPNNFPSVHDMFICLFFLLFCFETFVSFNASSYSARYTQKEANQLLLSIICYISEIFNKMSFKTQL